MRFYPNAFKSHSCPECNETFRLFYNLYIHYRKIHRTIPYQQLKKLIQRQGNGLNRGLK